jgi:cytochrome c biogenesis protein CcmG/thiol:disulfide interchange protein DsbE
MVLSKVKKIMLNKFQLPLLIFVMIITFMWHGLAISADQLPCATLGTPVPKFSMENLLGEPAIVTEKIFHGKITVVEVFASYCRGCVKQNELMKTLNKSDEYQLIGLDYKDNLKSADQWLNKHGNPYKVVIFDPKGHLGMDIGVYGTPTLFIIDSKGIIRYRHFGQVTHETWHELIVPELNKLKA